MSNYWVLYSKLTLLSFGLWWLLARAPARWRFRVALGALLVASVPWQWVPRFQYNSPVVARWLAPLSAPAQGSVSRWPQHLVWLRVGQRWNWRPLSAPWPSV